MSHNDCSAYHACHVTCSTISHWSVVSLQVKNLNKWRKLVHKIVRKPFTIDSRLPVDLIIRAEVGCRSNRRKLSHRFTAQPLQSLQVCVYFIIAKISKKGLNLTNMTPVVNLVIHCVFALL